MLSDIGTQLCRHGEALYTLSVEGGQVVLHPVASFDVQGDYDPRSWRYQVTQSGPTSTTTRRLTADDVLHVRLSCDPGQPWRGRSPMSRCPETAALASALETRLAQEAASPVGALLGVPEGSDPDGDPLADLRAGIAGARGAPILHETVVSGYGDRGNAPYGDLRPVRLGANWPAAVAELRDPLAASVLSACGVPPTLAAVSSDGTAQRESFRRFLVSTDPAARPDPRNRAEGQARPGRRVELQRAGRVRHHGQGAGRRQPRQSGHEHRRRAFGREPMSLRPSIRRAVRTARRSARLIAADVRHEHGVTRNSSGKITYEFSDTRKAIVEPVTRTFRDKDGASRVSRATITFLFPVVGTSDKLTLPSGQTGPILQVSSGLADLPTLRRSARRRGICISAGRCRCRQADARHRQRSPIGEEMAPVWSGV